MTGSMELYQSPIPNDYSNFIVHGSQRPTGITHQPPIPAHQLPMPAEPVFTPTMHTIPMDGLKCPDSLLLMEYGFQNSARDAQDFSEFLENLGMYSKKSIRKGITAITVEMEHKLAIIKDQETKIRNSNSINTVLKTQIEDLQAKMAAQMNLEEMYATLATKLQQAENETLPRLQVFRTQMIDCNHTCNSSLCRPISPIKKNSTRPPFLK